MVDSIKQKKMDGFSYYNIFETKGIEYLIIIAFFAILIPFWIILNKREKVKQVIKQALGVLNEKILKIPQGLYFSKNHTWSFMEKSGTAKIGVDDFLMHLTGEVKFNNLKNQGDTISKGDLLAEIDQGGKQLEIKSPVSGKIMVTNHVLEKNPEIANKDPYNKGWIYEIKPSNWKTETKMYYFAEDATDWVKKELVRFKDFLAVSMQNHLPELSLRVLLHILSYK